MFWYWQPLKKYFFRYITFSVFQDRKLKLSASVWNWILWNLTKFFWPLSKSKQKGFVYWLNFQWRLCAKPFLKKLTAGLRKVNLATLQTTITKVTMGWKLLLYDFLFFSKHYFFRIFSTHCGKICMKKAFHLVEHGWLLPYVGTFFKYNYFIKFSTHVQQYASMTGGGGGNGTPWPGLIYYTC